MMAYDDEWACKYSRCVKEEYAKFGTRKQPVNPVSTNKQWHLWHQFGLISGIFFLSHLLHTQALLLYGISSPHISFFLSVHHWLEGLQKKANHNRPLLLSHRNARATPHTHTRTISSPYFIFITKFHN